MSDTGTILLTDTERPADTNLNIGWQKPAVKKTDVHKVSNYDSQIIIQLENSFPVTNAAGALASKGTIPDNTIIVQLGLDGKYEVVHNDFTKIKGKIRWQAVGHGRDPKNGTNRTLAGYKAGELAKLFGDFQKKILSVESTNITPDHVSLVGCNLAGEVKREAFATKFIKALKAEGLNASVSAKTADIAVDIDGGKLAVGDHKVNVENLVMKKLVLSWDKNNKVVKSFTDIASLKRTNEVLDVLGKKNITEDALHKAGIELQELRKSPVMSDYERVSLQNASHLYYERMHEKVLKTRSLPAKNRSQYEQSLIKNVHASLMAKKINKIIANTMKKYKLNGDWAVVLDTAKEYNGLRFFNAKLKQSKTFLIKGEEYALVREYATIVEETTKDFNKSFVLENGVFKAKPEVHPNSIEHVSGLNAAYLIKSLVEVARSGFSHTSTSTKIMIVAQITQLSIATTTDVAKMAQVINIARTGVEWKTLSTVLSKVGTFMTVAAPIFDAFYIGVLIEQLSRAKTPLERKMILANLGLMSIQLGIDVAILIAAYLTTKTIVLSTGAVVMAPIAIASSAVLSIGVILLLPLLGITGGVGFLVAHYLQLEESYNSTVKFFNSIDTQLNGKLLTTIGSDNSVERLAQSISFSKIDLVKKTVTLGSLETSKSIGGKGHTHCSNWDSYWTKPYMGTKKFVDVYKGLGSAKERKIAFSDKTALVLPYALNRRLKLHYAQAPGARYKNPKAFLKMRKNLGTTFVWGAYGGAADWSVRFTSDPEILCATPVEVNLDSERSLIMPNIIDKKHRSLLSYDLIGNGGQYSVILPYLAIKTSITCKKNDKETWLFYVNSVANAFEIKDNNLINKHVPIPNFYKNLNINGTTLTIGSQSINLKGSLPKIFTFIHDLRDNKVILETLMDTKTGKKIYLFKSMDAKENDDIMKVVKKILKITKDLKLLKKGDTIALQNVKSLIEIVEEKNDTYTLMTAGTKIVVSGNVITNIATSEYAYLSKNMVTGSSVSQLLLDLVKKTLNITNLTLDKKVKMIVSKPNSVYLNVLIDTVKGRALNSTWNKNNVNYIYMANTKPYRLTMTMLKDIDTDASQGIDFSKLMPVDEYFITAKSSIKKIVVPKVFFRGKKTSIVLSNLGDITIHMPELHGKYDWHHDGPDVILKTSTDSLKLIDAEKAGKVTICLIDTQGIVKHIFNLTKKDAPSGFTFTAPPAVLWLSLIHI